MTDQEQADARIAVITGGAAGFGKAHAERLAKAGFVTVQAVVCNGGLVRL